MSLGRVRYDNFVMQRGWCLAHRLVASKFTPPTNSGASQNYHTARGVQVRRATRLPQMSLVLQLISNGCSLRAAREIKRLTDLGPWTGGLCSSDLEPPWLDLGPPLLIEGGVSGISALVSLIFIHLPSTGRGALLAKPCPPRCPATIRLRCRFRANAASGLPTPLPLPSHAGPRPTTPQASMEGASGRVLVLAPLAISTDRTPAAQPAAQPQCPQEHGNRTASRTLAWLEPRGNMHRHGLNHNGNNRSRLLQNASAP